MPPRRPCSGADVTRRLVVAPSAGPPRSSVPARRYPARVTQTCGGCTGGRAFAAVAARGGGRARPAGILRLKLPAGRRPSAVKWRQRSRQTLHGTDLARPFNGLALTGHLCRMPSTVRIHYRLLLFGLSRPSAAYREFVGPLKRCRSITQSSAGTFVRWRNGPASGSSIGCREVACSPSRG